MTHSVLNSGLSFFEDIFFKMKNQFRNFIVLVLLSLGAAQENVVKRSEYLDPEKIRFLAEWEVDFESKTITFNLTVQGTGYVGFGISPSPNMKGADILVGGVRDNGEIYLNDYHAEDNGYPSSDSVSNWELLDASESEGVTNLRFWRQLDTCDDEDVAITEDTQYMIWAIGETDILTKHAGNSRGPKVVNILDPPIPEIDTSMFKTWNISHSMRMPPEDTYWCTIHKAPDFDGVKHHIVGFAPVLPSPLSVKHTHHLTLSVCSPPEGSTSDEAFEKYLGHPGAECYAMSSELPVEHCRSVFYIWAVGGEPLFLPEVAGYPVGTTNDSLYVMIEIHYDNPDLDDDAHFETAVEVYYTEETREHDASIIMVMHDVSPFQTIPPETNGFITVGHCGSETTKEQIPAEGVHVFNAMLHAHTAGKAMKVRHFRDGKELPWLAVDNHYDFNYQASRPYKEYVEVNPGDAMTIECTYDTSARKKATIGGFPSSYEMCQAFFWHYPTNGLIACSSQADPTFLELLGIQEWEWSGQPHDDLFILKPEDFQGMNYSSYLNQLNWTPTLKDELQAAQRYGSHTSDKGLPIQYPEVDEAWMPPKTCQDTTNESPNTETDATTTEDLTTLSGETTTPSEENIIKRSEYLDTEKTRFLAEWEVNFESKIITFNLTVQGTGFVGFGISPSPNMKGADIFVGGVRDNGESYFNDYHAEDNGYPTLDSVNNWELLGASESNGKTNLRFRRQLDTCDEEDVAITEDTQNMIWAIGDTDVLTKHANNNRGSKVVNVLDPPTPEVDTSIFKNWTIPTGLLIPKDDTTYWCTIHKAPDFGGVKHHIVGFKPIFPNPISVKHTHHLTVSVCTPPEGSTSDEAFEEYLGHPGAECYGTSPDLPVENCFSVFYIWAVGGEPLFLPEIAGYPVGTTNDSLYVMIEVHYDNPDLDDNAYVETSVEVYYTDETRENDASILIVMHDTSPFQTIPPETNGFVNVGHCGSDATKEQIPAEGVHVFNGMLHAHTAGKSMKVRHFRDRKELPWLAVDKHYDFNYQTSRPYKEYVDIHPGDAMTIECTYDTSSRKTATIGGFPSRSEMCQAFFWIYPANDFIVCSSEADPVFLELLGIQKWEWSGQPNEEILVLEPERMNYTTYLNKLNWTSTMINNLQIAQRYENHTSDHGPINYPEFDEAWMPPKTCQDTTNESPNTETDATTTPSEDLTTPSGETTTTLTEDRTTTDKATTPSEDTAAPSDTTTTPPQDRTTTDKATTSSEDTAAPSDTTTTPPEDRTTDKATTPSEDTAAPSDTTTTPPQDRTTTDKATPPSEDGTTPTNESTTTPLNETTAPTEETTTNGCGNVRSSAAGFATTLIVVYMLL